MKQLTKLRLLLMCSGVTLTALAAPPNPPAGFKWEVVNALTDEFNSGELDTNKWHDFNPDWVGRPPGMFEPAQVSVKGGYLRLKNSKVAETSERIYIHTGIVVSKKFQYAIGMYSECKLKAATDGTVTGFWFSKPRHAEIDVQEAIGFPLNGQTNLTTVQRTNTHYIPMGYGEENGEIQVKKNSPTVDVGENFITYGVWWKDDRNIHFYNDTSRNTPVVETVTGGPFTDPLRLRMDTEVQNWLGAPPAWRLNDNRRNTSLIDFVRTWKLVPVSSGDDTSNACSGGSITRLRVAKTTARSVAINFNNLGDTKNYEVRTYLAGTFTGSLKGALKFKKVTKSFLNVKGLSPNTDYTFVVRAICNEGGTSSVARIDGSTKARGTKSINESLGVDINNNPVSNGVLNLSNSVGFSYSISNITGQSVQSGDVESDSIDVSGLSSGIYIIEFVKDGLTEIKKLIIE